MFEKWDSAQALAREGDVFAQCVVERAKEVVVANEKCPVKDSLLPMLEGLEVRELDVEAELRSRVEASVAKNEGQMAGALRENISRWTAQREEEVMLPFGLKPFIKDVHTDSILRGKGVEPKANIALKLCKGS